MTSTNALVSVLILIIALLGLFLLYRELMPRWEKLQDEKAARRKEEMQKQASLSESLAKLADAMNLSAKNEADGTMLLAGTIKACEAIATSVDGLRSVVTTLSALIAAPKPDPQYPPDQLLAPNSEEEAELAHDTFERVLRRGIPLDQAVQEAKEAQEKKTMFATAELDANV